MQQNCLFFICTGLFNDRVSSFLVKGGKTMRSTGYNSENEVKRTITVELTNAELQIICNTFFYAVDYMKNDFPYIEDQDFWELRADLYGVLCFVDSGVIPKDDKALKDLQSKVIELRERRCDKIVHEQAVM